MLRRVVPVVAGAAAVLLVPSAAAAAPAPVANYSGGWGYTAYAEEVPLPDGRTAAVRLWKYHPGAGAPVLGHLSVQIWTDYPCLEYVWPEPGAEDEEPVWVPGTCKGGEVYGDLQLTADDFEMGRDLRTGSVEAVLQMPVSDWTPPEEDDGEPTDPGEGEWTDPGEGEWTDPEEEFPPFPEPEMEPVAVSVVFTATGPMETSTEHGTLCGDGESECQSVRIYADREASVSGTVDGLDIGSAPARFSAVKGLDVGRRTVLPPL